MNEPPLSRPISARVDRLRRGDDPQLIARMSSGWAILNDAQPEPVTGACILLPDPVVASVNGMDAASRTAFMTDFVRLGDAILAATGAERINYLILCNQVPELHGHAVPRFAHEDPEHRRLGPFEAYDFARARRADALGVDAELLARVRSTLATAVS